MQEPVEDHVVLVHDDGTPRGTAPRATVHGADTPLHLAFSCYVLNADRQLLVTRRALTKVAWPGVWTNSLCGHPRWGEDVAASIERRADDELGFTPATLTGIREVLPDFRYRAVDPGGTVEHEICPVFVASAEGEPEPHPDEVLEYRWVPLAEVEALVRTAPWAVSPWMAEQVQGVLAALRSEGSAA